MSQRYGIVLLEKKEIILRVYEAGEKEWRLIFYQNKVLQNDGAAGITEAIAEFLVSEQTQHIADWKLCSRNIPQSVIRKVSSATGFAIENLTELREQELLCKGMFTELW